MVSCGYWPESQPPANADPTRSEPQASACVDPVPALTGIAGHWRNGRLPLSSNAWLRHHSSAQAYACGSEWRLIPARFVPRPVPRHRREFVALSRWGRIGRQESLVVELLQQTFKPQCVRRSRGHAVHSRNKISLALAVGLLPWFLGASYAAEGSEKGPDPAGIEFFEKQIRPALVGNCAVCHSGAAAQGGLRLGCLLQQFFHMD